jgi:hypothetical protein
MPSPLYQNIVTGQLNDVFRHLIIQRLTLNVSLKTEEYIVNTRVEELGERLLLDKCEFHPLL